MNKKPIYPILQQRYKAIEKKEDALRSQFATLRKAKLKPLQDLIYGLYRDCVDGDTVDYSLMFKRISRQTANQIKYVVDKMRKETDIVSFPFTVTRFDQLNKLDAVKAQIIVNELEQANELNVLLEAYLHDHIFATMMATVSALAIDYQITDKAVKAVATNKDHPIKEALQEQHYKIAERTALMLQQAITRGEDAEKAVDLITAYANKRDKNSDDRLMYTEDTRATVEAVEEVLEDRVDYFRTVCVHDGKACDICTGIEAEQKLHPVPMKNFVSGVNAPPFHPYCRCSIEVIYNDDGDEIE